VVGYVKETVEKKNCVLNIIVCFFILSFSPVPFLYLEHFTWKAQFQDEEIGKRKEREDVS
jgi:hypothetical protein